MIRQDYILRMIEQAAQMLAQLIRSRRNDDPDSAAMLEHEVARQFLELDDQELFDSDDERLFHHLRGRGAPREFPVRLGVAVSLLEAHAEELRQSGETTAANEMISKAIALYIRASLESLDADVPSFAPGLSDLLRRTPIESLGIKTAVLLVCYHERFGRFADAETALFNLQQVVGPDPGLCEVGRGFFERLLRQSDEGLAEGNLPRAEVESGLKEWNALFEPR